MRYNKKNVPLLLVPLLIIIFFSGNASADTYSFSLSSTFGDRDIFNFTVNSGGTINGEATWTGSTAGIRRNASRGCIRINGEATWTGSAADLALILNGPGQEGYYARVDGLSPLSLSYTVTTADLSKGTDWRLSIVNFGGGDATGTVTILYSTDLLIARRTPHPSQTFSQLAYTNASLEPFIYIDIDSSPQGAQIWIDDEYCGVTPLTEYFDRPEDHTFKLCLDEYKPYQKSFFISESRTLDVVLEPLPEAVVEPFIYIVIVSSPQGAQIWIDGEYCGVTPLRESFDRPGDHTFKLSLNEYKPYQKSFFISESSILDVVLEPLPEEIPTPVVEPFIYIVIVSSPQGAQIWIDGEYCGVTPLRESFDRPGDHTFKLSLNEYKPYQKSFFISESSILDVVLESLPEETPTPVAEPFIYIDIDSSPQGAQIWIDGEYCDVTPFTKYFDRPGDHTFKLSLNGYKTCQESFFISESRTLDLILEPLDGETSGSPARKPVPSHPSPTPPGFLALSLLIAIFFVYFFKFKNKRWRKSKN